MIRAGTWATPPRLYAVWLALGFLFSPTGTLGPQLEKRGDNCWKDCWESVGGCWLIVADQVGLWKRELGLRVLGVLFIFIFYFWTFYFFLTKSQVFYSLTSSNHNSSFPLLFSQGSIPVRVFLFHLPLLLNFCQLEDNIFQVNIILLNQCYNVWQYYNISRVWPTTTLTKKTLYVSKFQNCPQSPYFIGQQNLFSPKCSFLTPSSARVEHQVRETLQTSC